MGTGVWPIVHLRSFEKVVGPKVDKWLVKTFGALIATVGAVLAVSSLERHRARSTKLLGVGTALTIAAAEVVYVAKSRISPIYLLDVGLELVAVAGWLLGGAASSRKPRSTERR